MIGSPAGAAAVGIAFTCMMLADQLYPVAAAPHAVVMHDQHPDRTYENIDRQTDG